MEPLRTTNVTGGEGFAPPAQVTGTVTVEMCIMEATEEAEEGEEEEEEEEMEAEAVTETIEEEVESERRSEEERAASVGEKPARRAFSLVSDRSPASRRASYNREQAQQEGAASSSIPSTPAGRRATAVGMTAESTESGPSSEKGTPKKRKSTAPGVLCLPCLCGCFSPSD